MNSQSDGHIRPNAEDLEKGTYYHSRISNELDFAGVIVDQAEVIRWRFGTWPKRSPFSPLNLLQKPDFVVTDPDEREVIRVRCETRFSARFGLVENEQVVGRIERRSLLRNKYTLALEGGITWTFHMPLFSVRFHGQTNEGTNVWVLVGPSKRQWNILVEPEADSLELVLGLAFIHRQWWCYS